MEISRPIPGWTPSTPDVQGRAIEDLMRIDPVLAIHFWAPWNGSDPRMDRSIREIQARFAGRVSFLSCNVDLEPNGAICREFGVRSIPATGLARPGHPLEVLIGCRDPEPLASKIEAWLVELEQKPWWAFWR